ncbi:DUF4236 domain-containing protein [Mesorhizobium sp. M1E.F.Ca.ET.063.01.1.1]|uniref:DUF4236 domain-containing protein n=1 Tax=Mesorhizobium sp. M1E.F.Ca.ET.063.01.1.1 TaxID=2496750 RepID=UPI000FCC3641|nr:DUF4236 domain-containing protein [Mesorhizobium sp. M1E.F.Ca.ET.063.01.1.1]RUW85318.1 DUF4236 domain-containing protein [Mesorhizobium sp. M1E.F.Ca.ET.063.01.1.1]
MGFYIRKSVSAGPFRFNFSKGGVGASVGVKGFRLGTGPRGHYVHAGVGGVYYRTSLGSARQRAARPPAPARVEAPKPRFDSTDGVQMVEIESGDVVEMRDAAFSDFLAEINEKQKQLRVSVLLGGSLGALAAFAFFAIGPVTGGLLGAVAAAGLAFGNWLDSYHRTAVLFYELDDHVHRAYEQVTTAFDKLAACAGVWHVEAAGPVQDLTTWKRNAGASHLVKKSPTAMTYKLPAVVKSNVTPASVQVGRQVIYFMPDIVLIDDRGRFGAVAYSDLKIAWQDSNFIENGTVPRDAVVVGHTWAHPNKKGGPDRRFNNNRQIPICLYEIMHLRSASGVNELLEFSRSGFAAPFAQALAQLSSTRRWESDCKRATVVG